MYLMFNMIHTDVLKFIDHIIFINNVIFESILNLIFIIKLFLKKKTLFIYIYNYILFKVFMLFYNISNCTITVHIIILVNYMAMIGFFKLIL